MIRTLILVVLFSAAAWSQTCGKMVVNPTTGKMDCVGNSATTAAGWTDNGTTVSTTRNVSVGSTMLDGTTKYSVNLAPMERAMRSLMQSRAGGRMGLSVSVGGSSRSGNISLGSVTSTVVSDSRYCSFPAIEKLQSGNLLVVYRCATSHTSADGNLYAKISTDQGATWGAEFTAYADGTYDSRDSEIRLLSDGRIALSFFKYDGALLHGVWVAMGTEASGTVTFDTPSSVSCTFTSYCATTSKVLELANGTLMLPVYGQNTGDTKDSAAVVFSSDGGSTWGGQRMLKAGTSTEDYNEANAVQLASGRIVEIIRHDSVTKAYVMSYSDDNGAMWSVPASVLPDSVTGLGRPTITLLGSGGLMLFARHTTGNQQSFTTSWDGGSTWSAWATTLGGAGMYQSASLLSGGEVAGVFSIETGTTVAHVSYQNFADGFGVFSRGYGNFKALFSGPISLSTTAGSAYLTGTDGTVNSWIFSGTPAGGIQGVMYGTSSNHGVLLGVGTGTYYFALQANGIMKTNKAFGNGYSTSTNSDNRGHLTLVAGTASYTFTQGPGTAGVWTTAPVCIIQDDTTLANLATSTKTVSTSTLTITGSVGTTDTYSYICWPGN